ncbi:MFS transporter [Mycolicibacterium brisbanense]|uniref:Integral membrane transport protein n=1 Tax=Mycolicibacterium brisbanense TaxID=146020 RepID=A0A100VZB4_9MYCO|nr:MFS transporter [Mycolicibacterium brisbanense]MCV7158900.1 MHS family MFS transporter [Mycolicibacterium brisbanense]GAS88753.1 integral membrane transport protein [Mycolicibacterium brisbanense]
MATILQESQGTPMKRVAMASFVGSAIEYYDFYIYGTAAALVFPKVFFPHLGTTMATVASMATFAAAFLSRPLGAAFFGHFGDRLGRKSTLIATLLIMGLSTVAVGTVPSAATIGMAAPLILLTLRLVQGFAVGGEWAGAALLSAEYAPPAERGRYGMFTQMGVGSGLVMSSLLFLAVNKTIGESSHAFVVWGWRIPFLFSAVLVVIALYVRLNVAETPVFTGQARGAAPVTPLTALLRGQRREVLLAAGSMVGFFALGYMANAYLMSYAHTRVGFSPDLILQVGLLGGVIVVVFNALSAVLSDRFGRRRVIMVALAAGVPWTFVVLPLIDTGNAALFTLAMSGTYAIAASSYGPMAAFIPEIFRTRYRYSGAGLSLNLAGLIGGAVPTIVAAPLLAAWGTPAVGAMMAVVVLVSLVCTSALPETKGAVLQ